MSKLILNPEFNLYERNGQAFCSSRQVAEEFEKALNKMDIAVHRSYLHPDEINKNLGILDDADELLPNKYDYPFLRNACRETVIRNFLDTRITEKDVHNWFRKKVSVLLGEHYRIVYRKNDKRHIPDFWIKGNETYIPVEIKLHKFSPRHLQQLLRYMNVYDCAQGIAVALELNCNLPSNINFIKYNPEEVWAG